MKLPPFKLEHYFARYEFSAPYLLCSSDCESFSIGELLNMKADAARELQELRLGYTETLGDPRLREEIASLYADINPDQVLVHAGGEEPIFNFIHSTLEARDHV